MFSKKKNCKNEYIFQSVLLKVQREFQNHFKSTTFQKILRGEQNVLLSM